MQREIGEVDNPEEMRHENNFQGWLTMVNKRTLRNGSYSAQMYKKYRYYFVLEKAKHCHSLQYYKDKELSTKLGSINLRRLRDVRDVKTSQRSTVNTQLQWLFELEISRFRNVFPKKYIFIADDSHTMNEWCCKCLLVLNRQPTSVGQSNVVEPKLPREAVKVPTTNRRHQSENPTENGRLQLTLEYTQMDGFVPDSSNTRVHLDLALNATDFVGYTQVDVSKTKGLELAKATLVDERQRQRVASISNQ